MKAELFTFPLRLIVDLACGSRHLTQAPTATGQLAVRVGRQRDVQRRVSRLHVDGARREATRGDRQAPRHVGGATQTLAQLCALSKVREITHS